MSEEVGKIEEFFKGQTVFLTGASGFLGKVLIEKLLRQCKDLDKIYVLMRSKKGKTPKQRFEEFFNFPCFDRLKYENAEALKKVSLVIGDGKEPNLGIHWHDLEILKNETTCVIHAAASVKFDQTLKEATANVRATKEMLELAKEMSRLRVFVYISTAYSNCIHHTVKEDFYEPPMKAEVLFTMVEGLDDATLDAITPKLLGDWPNTYVYTKCISEELVKRENNNLPIAIIRPAIVVSSKDEPMPGWIDNFNGPIGLSAGTGLGLIRVIMLDSDVTAYIVPVDYVANLTLAAAWKRESSGETRIYNYVGSSQNRITWGTYIDRLQKKLFLNYFSQAIWYYFVICTKHRFLYRFYAFFLHTLVSYLLDFVLFCCGKPLRAVEGYRRLDKAIEAISYFNTRNWIFYSDNVDKLWDEMNSTDRKNFFFTMERFDWESLFWNGTIGVRIYLLKDPMETLPKARRKMKFLAVVHYTVVALFYYFVYKMIRYVLSY